MSATFASASSQYLQESWSAVTGAPLTISCWFKTSLTTGVSRTLVSIGASTDLDVFQLFQWTTGLYLWIDDGGGNNGSTGGGTVAANTWTHGLAVCRSATDRETFVNGVSAGTSANSVVPGAIDSLAIGRRITSSPGDYHDGAIAEVAIWGAALSSAEIARLAAGRNPMSVSPTPTRYWPLLDANDLVDRVAGDVLTAFNSPGNDENPPNAELLEFGRFPNPGFPLGRAA